LFCLFPTSFSWLAAGFAVLCFWTAIARVLDAFSADSESGL
jgi:hypothetical protein